jgi:hypothetical protein
MMIINTALIMIFTNDKRQSLISRAANTIVKKAEDDDAEKDFSYRRR